MIILKSLGTLSEGKKNTTVVSNTMALAPSNGMLNGNSTLFASQGRTDWDSSDHANRDESHCLSTKWYKMEGRNLHERVFLFFGFPFIKPNSSELQALSTHQTIKLALV